jgi:hypothetical protein
MEKKKELFIKKSIELWGYKYDYSKVEYIDYKTAVKIGYKGLWYSQTPNKHLQGKKIECQETRMSNENFIILSKKVWGEDRFDYSECEYLGTNIKVKLFDKLNNRWIEQVAKSHLKGYEVVKLTNNEFLEKCSIIHDYSYEYDLSNYESLNSRIKIFCHIHGHFELKASTHIYGSGCKDCDISIFFKRVKQFFNTKNILYITNHSFNELKAYFKFYIPSLRTVIEFDGIQHYQPISYFGGIETYERLKINDKIKNDYCEDNYINLIRIKYNQIDDIEEIITNMIKPSN